MTRRAIRDGITIGVVIATAAFLAGVLIGTVIAVATMTVRWWLG